MEKYPLDNITGLIVLKVFIEYLKSYLKKSVKSAKITQSVISFVIFCTRANNKTRWTNAEILFKKNRCERYGSFNLYYF